MKNTGSFLRKAIALICVCVLLTLPVGAAYGENCPAGEMPVPGCDASYVVELTSGTVIYANNEHTKMYPASTTKLMTALLAIEHIEAGKGSLSDIIIFSEEAVYGIDRDTMHINISVGEKLTVEEVLYAILLPSANEACLGMAEYVAGSIPGFIAAMNARAGELGMANTHYVTANGLHDDNHYTTAYDMSLLMREVLKHDVLVRIMSTATYVLPETNMSVARTLSNTNKCIQKGNEYYNEYVVCGKTGYTTPAGNTLVTYSEIGDQKYIAVFLKAAQGMSFSSTDKLMDYLAENVTLTKIENLIDFAVSVPVNGGESVIMAQPAVSFSVLTHVGDDFNTYRKEYSLINTVTLPVYAGDVVGTLSLYDGDTLVASVSMVSRANYGVTDDPGTGGSVTWDSGQSEQTAVPPDSEAPSEHESTASSASAEKKYGTFKKVFLRVLVVLLMCIVACVLIYGVVLVLSIRSYNRKKRMRREGEPDRSRDGGGPENTSATDGAEEKPGKEADKHDGE